jgi:hypothetical protein
MISAISFAVNVLSLLVLIAAPYCFVIASRVSGGVAIWCLFVIPAQAGIQYFPIS